MPFDLAGERRLGEARTDAGRDVRHGHGVIELRWLPSGSVITGIEPCYNDQDRRPLPAGTPSGGGAR